MGTPGSSIRPLVTKGPARGLSDLSRVMQREWMNLLFSHNALALISTSRREPSLRRNRAS